MKRYYASAVIFTGSMLLFGIQPMLGRTLLPVFGGSAAVWTVCLAAFQALLFAGYLYAHLISVKPLHTQRFLHLILLGIATLWTLGFVYLLPSLRHLVGASRLPALKVVFSVLFTAGLPYVLLAAGSTIVQVWVAQARSGTKKGVYKLYAVSNFGSFAGLLAYPLLIEPFISLRLQWFGFAILLGAYTALLARQSPAAAAVMHAAKEMDEKVSPPDPRATGLWFFLPFCSVFLLNALTAHITLDIMPLPLLWAALLALFLLSYVVGFSGVISRWHLLLPFVAAGFAIFSALMSPGFRVVDSTWNFAATFGLCFFGPLFLHHWLYQLRPETEYLTRYYLGNAAGGAVGGLFASIVAPRLFKTVLEYPIALCLLAVALIAYAVANLPRKKMAAADILTAASISLLVSGYIFIWMPRRTDQTIVWRDRGFFGTLRVTEIQEKTGSIREFYHGNTLHGIQAFIPSLRRWPAAYYTPDTGGLAIVHHPKHKRGESMRVALAGVGVGVLFAYGNEGDFYRGYEISPEVLNVATNPALFSFIADSPADVDLRLGDARKLLEAERDADEAPYDVIYIDAFSGDNVPLHLSTKEAFQLYFDRLAPDGILAVNISNRYLELAPLIKSVGIAFECPVLVMRKREDRRSLRSGSVWAFFMRNPPDGFAVSRDAWVLDLGRVRDFELPTDDKGSFISLVKWPWLD